MLYVRSAVTLNFGMILLGLTRINMTFTGVSFVVSTIPETVLVMTKCKTTTPVKDSSFLECTNLMKVKKGVSYFIFVCLFVYASL